MTWSVIESLEWRFSTYPDVVTLSDDLIVLDLLLKSSSSDLSDY